MSTRTIKIGLAIYLLFAAYVFLKLWASAPGGYEISLYANTPWETWLLVGVGVLGGIWIMVRHALCHKEGNGWAYGFALAVFANLVIVTLGVLRGYFGWFGNDPNAHYGMVMDYLATGHIKDTNIYPIYHIGMMQAITLTGLSIAAITKLYPAFLTVASMVLVLALARLVLKDRAAALLAIAAGVPMLYGLYHIQVYPRGLGQVLLPGMIWLYLLARENKTPMLSLSLIVCIGGFTFVHPMVTVFFLLFLATYEFSVALARIWSERARATKAILPSGSKLWTGIRATPLSFGVVGFFVWFFFVRGLADGLVIQVALSLTGQRKSEWLDKAMSQMGVTGWRLPEFFFKLYGADWWMWGLSGLGMLLIIRRFWRGDNSVQPLAVLVPWLLLTNIIWIPFFRWVGGSALIETNTMSALAAVFAGWLLWHLFGRSDRASNAKVVVVTGVIAIGALLGILALYRSPYLYQATPQLLKSDLVANRWIIERKLPFVQYTGLGAPYTVAFLNIGEGALDYDRPDLNVSVEWTGILRYNREQIPSHFGYEEHQIFGEQFVLDKYVILTERFDITRNNPTLRNEGRVVGPAVGRWDFDDADLSKWEQDKSVDRIYDNGDSRIYLARGTMWQ